MEKRFQEMEKRFIKRCVYCQCMNQLSMKTSQFLDKQRLILIFCYTCHMILRFNNEFIFLLTRRIGANTALK